jgi:TLD
MRHNRTQSTVSSLYEQAHLESIIDVYMCTNKSQRIQVCHHDGIAVGGDDTKPLSINASNNTTTPKSTANSEENCPTTGVSNNSGFAIALFDYKLLRGTTSQSTVFNCPSLIGPGNKTEIFYVAGFEVWSFTPCFDLPSAEQLEMSKFITEALSSSSLLGLNTSHRTGLLTATNWYNSNNKLNNSAMWQQSPEAMRNRFYRRMGDETCVT